MPVTELFTPVDTRVSIAGSQFCFAKFRNMGTVETIRNDEILCAHVDPEIEGDAVGREINKFSLELDITVPILEAILPHLGFDEDTGVYTSDLSLSSFTTLVDFGATIHKWVETFVIAAVFRGGVSTMPISLELHCIGVQEVDDAAATFTEGAMDYIYGWPGSNLTIASTAYNTPNFALAIDRKLVFDWNSSNFITGVGRGPRSILLATQTPYLAANKAVYWSNKTYLAGREVILTLTNGIDTIAIELAKAKLNPKGPSIEDLSAPIRLPLTWEARRQVDPDTPACTITIASV